MKNFKLFLKFHWSGNTRNTTIYAFIAESYVFITEKILFHSALCSAHPRREQTTQSVFSWKQNASNQGSLRQKDILSFILSSQLKLNEESKTQVNGCNVGFEKM